MSEPIGRFEDIIAWQKARLLTARIYRVTSVGKFAGDYGLRDQIRRASVSAMSNIAEGYERGTPNEFHHFLVIAKGSCAEVRSLLCVALDAGYIDKTEFRSLYAQSEEVGRIIGGLRSSVMKRRPAKDGSLSTHDS